MIRVVIPFKAIICVALLLPQALTTAQSKPVKVPNEIQQILARKVSLTAKNEDVQSVLENLFHQAGANYAFNLLSFSKVSVSFKSAPFGNALNSVLSSVGYYYRIVDGVFTVERISDAINSPLQGINGASSGLAPLPPGTPVKIQVHFLSASDAAERIQRIIGFRPEDGFTVNANKGDNTLIVTTRSMQQFREFKDLLRLIDLLPRAMVVRADTTLKTPGHPIQTYSTTAVAYNGTPFTLSDATGTVRATAIINADNSVTFDLNWNSGKQIKSVSIGSFTGKVTNARGETRLVCKRSIRMPGKRFAEAQLFLTATPRELEISFEHASWLGKNVIVKPFVDSTPGTPNGLASTVTDAFIRELAGTRRYDVIKSEEVKRTEDELGIKQPASNLDDRQVANALAIDIIAEGQLLSVVQDTSRQGSPVTARLRVQLRNAYTRDVLREADITTTQTSVPGGQPESALRKACYALAVKSAEKLTETAYGPYGTILALEKEDGRTSVVINAGANDGIAIGQQMAVMHGNFRAGKFVIYKVSPFTSRGRLIENKMGVRVEDQAIPILRDGQPLN